MICDSHSNSQVWRPHVELHGRAARLDLDKILEDLNARLHGFVDHPDRERQDGGFFVVVVVPCY
jgi:hypothetical protein